jgi:hypothetical protein
MKIWNPFKRKRRVLIFVVRRGTRFELRKIAKQLYVISVDIEPIAVYEL